MLTTEKGVQTSCYPDCKLGHACLRGVLDREEVCTAEVTRTAAELAKQSHVSNVQISTITRLGLRVLYTQAGMPGELRIQDGMVFQS